MHNFFICLGAGFLCGIVFSLRKIVDKVDKNSDGKVTQEELQEWIQYIAKKFLMEDAKKQFDSLFPKDGKVTLDAYVEHTHGKPGII